MAFGKLISYLKKKKIKKNTPGLRTRAKNKKIRKTKIKKIKRVKPGAIKKEKLVAYATHYFSKIKVAVLKMKDRLEIDERIHIKGFTTDFMQTVASMQIDRKPVEIVKKGQEIGLLVKRKVRHKDKVYKI